MILSHKQIEEIAAAVTKDFNEFFFGKDADNERSTAQATPESVGYFTSPPGLIFSPGFPGLSGCT